MNFENFNDEVKVPTSDFVQSYAIAYNMVDSMVTTHSGYWTLIKACQKHIQGEKPNDPKELKQKGLGWVWNFNFGKGRAKIEKGVAENIARISSAISLGYPTFREQKEDDAKDETLRLLTDENLRGIASSVIGYSMVSTLLKETRLSSWLNEIEYPTYAFGYCALIFDKYDWMPDPVPPLNIAFPRNTKPEKVTSWVTFAEMEPNEVYQRWAEARNEATKTYHEGGLVSTYSKSGWNLEALEEVLAKLYRGKVEGKNSFSWSDIIPIYNSNPQQVISNTDSLQIAKLYNKELDGNLTEVYIAYSNPWQIENKNGEKAENGYNGKILYKRNLGKFSQKKNILFVRDSGFSESGFIEDFRGIAKYAVEDSIRYNRVRNNIGNKSIFIGAPTFLAQTGQAKDKFKVSVQQPFVVYDANFQPFDKQPTYDIASHINILRFEEGEYLRDTQQYDATIQGRLTSRPNRGEVEQVTQEVQFTSNAKNSIKFRDYSAIFYAVVTRMPELALTEEDDGYEGLDRFYKTVQKMLPDYIKSKADVNKLLKAIDSYSIEPILNSIETIMFAIQQSETPFARNRYKRMLGIAQGFPIEEVNIMTPLITDKFTHFQDSRLVAIENDMFWTTNEVVAQKTDDQIVHLDGHLAKTQQVIQGLQEQRLQPKDAAAFLNNSIQHIILHLEMLGEDPVMNRRAQEYMEQVRQIDNFRKQAITLAQQQAQMEAEQAGQVQIDPKTQSEIASKNMKAVTDQQRKDWLGVQRTQQRAQDQENRHTERMRELELKYAQPRI